MLGRPIIRFDVTSSTMTELAALAATGAPEGTTVVTGFQTAGRGRAGRQWVTPPGAALLASVLLRPELPLQRLTPLSILVADAIASVATGEYSLDAKIKWPNDVLVDGRKLSGVLIQSRPQSNGFVVIVGMGINANIVRSELPPTATSLLAETDEPIDLDSLLRHVLDALEIRYRELLADDLEQRWKQIQGRLGLRREFVTIEDGESVVDGILDRVDPDGALVLDRAGSESRVVVGDLVRGPKQATRP